MQQQQQQQQQQRSRRGRRHRGGRSLIECAECQGTGRKQLSLQQQGQQQALQQQAQQQTGQLPIKRADQGCACMLSLRKFSDDGINIFI